jgi:hypothetical protein
LTTRLNGVGKLGGWISWQPAPSQKLRFFDHITSFSPHKESKVHTQKEKKNEKKKKKGFLHAQYKGTDTEKFTKSATGAA